MPKAPKTATTRKKKAASVPDASYSRKVQVVHEVVNIPKVIHGRVPNLAWQLGQIGSQVGTQVGTQVGPKLATVNHPTDYHVMSSYFLCEYSFSPPHTLRGHH